MKVPLSEGRGHQDRTSPVSEGVPVYINPRHAPGCNVCRVAQRDCKQKQGQEDELADKLFRIIYDLKDEQDKSVFLCDTRKCEGDIM